MRVLAQFQAHREQEQFFESLQSKFTFFMSASVMFHFSGGISYVHDYHIIIHCIVRYIIEMAIDFM